MKGLKTISRRMYLATGERIWALVSTFLVIFLVVKDLNRPVYIAPPTPRMVDPGEVDSYYVKLEAAYVITLYSSFNTDNIEQRYRRLMMFMHPALRRQFEESFFGSGGNIAKLRSLGYEQVFYFDPDKIAVRGNTASVKGILEVYQHGKMVSRTSYCYTLTFTYIPPRIYRTEWGLLVYGIEESRC